jgi:hypothetical protein
MVVVVVVVGAMVVGGAMQLRSYSIWEENGPPPHGHGQLVWMVVVVEVGGRIGINIVVEVVVVVSSMKESTSPATTAVGASVLGSRRKIA